MGRRDPPPPRTLLPVPCSYGLMRQTLLTPFLRFFTSVRESLQVATSPCCRRDLPDVVSVNPSLGAWAPVTAVPRSAHACFFLHVIGLPQDTMGRLPVFIRECDFPRASCRGCRHFIMFRPLSSRCLPDRSYRCEFSHRAAETFYVRAYRASLPPHAPDMLSVRYR